MKKSSIFAAVCLCLTMLLGISSCSKDNHSDLLTLVGRDVAVAGFINVDNLLNSAQVTEKDRSDIVSIREAIAPGSELMLLDIMSSFKGLDNSKALYLMYSSEECATFVMSATDPDALDKSIQDNGYKPERIDDITVYDYRSSTLKPVIANGFLWLVKATSIDDAAEEVQTMVEFARNPAPQWIQDAIAIDDITALSVAAPLAAQPFKGKMTLSDAEMSAKIVFCDSVGNDAQFSLFDFSPITAEQVKCLDGRNLLNLAIGCIDGMSPSDAVRALDLGYRMTSELRSMIEKTTGRLSIAVALPGRDKDRASDFFKYQALVAVQCAEGGAATLLHAVRDVVSDFGVSPTSSSVGAVAYSLGMFGNYAIKADKDLLKLTANGAPDTDCPLSVPDDCLFYASVNLPSGYAPIDEIRLNHALLGEIAVTRRGVDMTMKFEGSKQGFLKEFATTFLGER